MNLPWIDVSTTSDRGPQVGAARNPKWNAEEEIRWSIGRFGLAELPLLDERTGLLVAGHGRVVITFRARPVDWVGSSER